MVKKTAKIWVVFQKFQKLKYLWNYNQVSSRRLRFTEKWKRNENGKLKELNLFINRNGTMESWWSIKMSKHSFWMETTNHFVLQAPHQFTNSKSISQPCATWTKLWIFKGWPLITQITLEHLSPVKKRQRTPNQ